eukprot:gene12153-15266_t
MQPSRLLLLLLIVLLGLGLPEVAGLRSLQETETESNAEAESESETERDSDSDGGSSSGRPHAAANTVTDWSGYVSLALTSKAGRMVPLSNHCWVGQDTGVCNVRRLTYQVTDWSGMCPAHDV